MRYFKSSNNGDSFEISDDGETIIDAYTLVHGNKVPFGIVTPLSMSDTLIGTLDGLINLYNLKEI